MLAERLRRLKSSLDRNFDTKPGAADIPAAPEAVGGRVATDVGTAHRVLRLRRAEHEADPDFCT
eukprot:6593377-Lingulodinium_polyedra.AAC.1